MYGTVLFRFGRFVACRDVFLVLKSSQLINHDLAHAYSLCDSSACGGKSDRPERFTLVLRRFHSLATSMEFRCFVHRGRILGVVFCFAFGGIRLGGSDCTFIHALFQFSLFPPLFSGVVSLMGECPMMACFLWNPGRVLCDSGICQRETSVFYPFLVEPLLSLLKAKIVEFWSSQVAPRWNLERYVMDVYVDRAPKHRVWYAGGTWTFVYL